MSSAIQRPMQQTTLGVATARGASLRSPCYDFNDGALPFGVDRRLSLVRERPGL